jgi:hypothetical protein
MVSLSLRERVSGWLRLDWLGESLRGEQNTGADICPFCTPSRPAVGPTGPHIKRVSGALFSELKRPLREGDHSPASSF